MQLHCTRAKVVVYFLIYCHWVKMHMQQFGNCFHKGLQCSLPRIVSIYTQFACFSLPTVQLSYKVTFARVPDMSCTHFRRILHTFQTRSGSGEKGVALTYILLQLYHEILCLHGCVSCAFWTCLTHVPAACEHYLELSCTVRWMLWNEQFKNG